MKKIIIILTVASMLFTGCNKKEVDELNKKVIAQNDSVENNTTDNKWYEFPNTTIMGTWVSSGSNGSERKWVFNDDAKFEYYENNQLEFKGKYFYVELDDYDTLNIKESEDINLSRNPLDEILLLYENGGQKIISGVWTNLFLLRMKIGDSPVYFTNIDYIDG